MLNILHRNKSKLRTFHFIDHVIKQCEVFSLNKLPKTCIWVSWL